MNRHHRIVLLSSALDAIADSCLCDGRKKTTVTNDAQSDKIHVLPHKCVERLCMQFQLTMTAAGAREHPALQ